MRVLLHGKSKAGLYFLPHIYRTHSSFSAIKLTKELWHKRFGHPASAVIHNNFESSSLDRSNKEFSICEACQRAKNHQLPYQSYSRITTCPIELVHTDVWGPTRISVGGFHYNVSFIYDYNRHTWIYLLKHKYDVELLSSSLNPMPKVFWTPKFVLFSLMEG